MTRVTKYLCVLAVLAGSLLGFSYLLLFGPVTGAVNRGWKVAGKYLQSADGDSIGLLNHLQTRTETKTELPPKQLPECPETPSRLLGLQNINVSLDLSLEHIVPLYPNLKLGGHFKPLECVARQRIAVITPFRWRETHLKIWLFYMHQFLQRQEGDYTIYVIEQHGNQTFNKGRLMNVGFTEALKNYDHSCFIFSDVDIIPIDDRNYYRCYGNPRHMGNALDKFNFRLFYGTAFGGVTAFAKEQFLKLNGFSNLFWGWGKEDDDMYQRVLAAGMKPERANKTLSKSRMIPHQRDPGNEINQKKYVVKQMAKI